MVGTLASRLNHYETLGLEPGASNEAVAQAFARQMRRFPPVGAAAQIALAYETLRNPAKRRAYDAALGLTRQPQRAPPAVTFQASGHFMGATRSAPQDGGSGGPGERRGADGARSVAPPMEAAPAQDTAPDHGPAPFIAAPPPGAADRVAPMSIRRATPALSPQPEPRAPSPAEDDQPGFPQAGTVPEPDHAWDSHDGLPAGAEDRPIPWNRAALAAGAVVVSAALLGAWAGMDAGDGPGSDSGQPTVSVALSPPKPFPTINRAEAEPEPEIAPARSRTRPAAIAAAPARRTAAPQPPAVPADRLAEIKRSLQSGDADSPPAQVAPELAAAEAPSAQLAAASLPLPNRVIARTIRQIGYSCGEVAATSPIEGEAPGVYKVTCTSGQSYRAAPVRGRYRFRRLGSN